MVGTITISNLVTYLSLLCGVFALYFAMLKNLHGTGLCIALCCICDMMDGRFARLFSRNEVQKATGVQLDSIVDALTFGAAPLAGVYIAVSPEPMTARMRH